MATTYQKQAKLKLITTVVAIVVIAGVMLVADYLKPKSATSSRALSQTSSAANTLTKTSAPTTGPTTTTTGGFRDGGYTASSNYSVPRGDESIQVSVMLGSGVVTVVSVQNSEYDSTSALYQEDFVSAYKSAVVGKKISSLRLGTVAGASDTTQGFNEAISQIASKAQS